jgi:hypothetical protein
MSEETNTPETEAQSTEQNKGQATVEAQHDWNNPPRVREAEPPPDTVEEVEDSGLQDLMVQRLYGDMGVLVEDEKAKEEPVKEPEAEPEAEVKVEEKVEEKPPPRTTIQNKDEITRDFVDSIRDVVRTEAATQAQQVTESLPIPPEPEPEPVDETEGLMEEQKMEVELMEQAEAQMPDKYKGFKGKTLAFYKDMNTWLDKKSEDDSDFNYENNAEEIDSYVEKNKPSLSKMDEKKVEMAMIRKQALEEFEEKSSHKFRELEQKTKMIEERPKILAETESFRGDVLDIEGLEATALLKAGKFEDAKAQYPMETKIAENVSSYVSQVYEDYMHYERGLATFESKKESLNFLDKFLSEQGQFFSKNGGEARVRDGKQFLPVSDYNRTVSNDSSKASQFWTFDGIDVRNLLAAEARSQIQGSISGMQEQISSYGYVRKPTDSADKPKEAPQRQQAEPITTPKSTVSVAPGPADGAEVADPNHPGENIIGTLGLREPFPQMIE